jgi:7-cyano-7-deazaguanine synthase
MSRSRNSVAKPFPERSLSIVVLASGGVDSTLTCLLSAEAGATVFPLFINYGQLAASREWAACQTVLRKLALPTPISMDLAGYGRTIPSGLTNDALRTREDAFLPGRNLLFLVAAAGYARSVGSNAVAIGLLREEDSLFPDQTRAFLSASQSAIAVALGSPITVVAPLIAMSKADVLRVAEQREISGTYFCHKGTEQPCQTCISCLERARAVEQIQRR